MFALPQRLDDHACAVCHADHGFGPRQAFRVADDDDGDMVVSTQWRSPAAELPLKPPPPHSRYGKTPQWCYIGDCKARAKAFLGTIKQEKFEKKTFEGHCQQVATRTRSRLKRQLRVRSTPKLSRCDSLHCGHYNLDLQSRLTIVTMLQSWYMSVLVASKNCLCVFARL